MKAIHQATSHGLGMNFKKTEANFSMEFDLIRIEAPMGEVELIKWARVFLIYAEDIRIAREA